MHKWWHLYDHDPINRLRPSINLVGSMKIPWWILAITIGNLPDCFVLHLLCFPISSISCLPSPGNILASIFMLVSIFQILPKSLLFIKNYFEYLLHYDFGTNVPVPFMCCRYETLQGFFVPALQDQLSNPVSWHLKHPSSLKVKKKKKTF